MMEYPELYEEATAHARAFGFVSFIMLQRRFNISFHKAHIIIAKMVDEGIVKKDFDVKLGGRRTITEATK